MTSARAAAERVSYPAVGLPASGRPMNTTQGRAATMPDHYKTKSESACTHEYVPNVAGTYAWCQKCDSVICLKCVSVTPSEFPAQEPAGRGSGGPAVGG